MQEHKNPFKDSFLKPVGWWIFTGIWLVLLISFILGSNHKTKNGDRTPEELLAGVYLPAESTWMGVYVKDRKLGYIHTEVKPLDQNGYELREFSRIKGSMLGTSQQLKFSMNILTDSSLALVEFNGVIKAEPYSTEFFGRVENEKLIIEVTTGGRISEKILEAPGPVYMSQVIKPLLQAGRLFEGDSLVLTSFDPLTLEMRDLVLIGAKVENYRLWGKDIRARKLITRLSGFESEIYVNLDGNTVAEFAPMELVMRREEMSKALEMDDNQGVVDFLSIYSIQPKGKINAPRKTVSVVFSITGVDFLKLLEASNRQSRVNNLPGVLKVESEGNRPYSDSINLDDYLMDEPFIESREKSIVTTALSIIKDAWTMEDTLKQLTNWVYYSVKKKPSAGLPSALAVLNNLEGDCNEHSVLFTAIARALGIPTRIQLGIVYQRGSFYYHAWNACFDGNKWVEIDATFGQSIADAARIALSSGNISNSLDLVSSVGNIEIEILDAQ